MATEQFIAARLLNSRLLTNLQAQALMADWVLQRGQREFASLRPYFPLYELPILANVSLDRIVKLRQEQPDAFLRYRLAITQAIKERQKGLTEIADIRAIYEDVVYPELERLHLSIRKLRSGTMRKMLGSFAVIASVVGGGLATGMIPPDIVEIVASLGGLEALRQAGSAVLAAGEQARSIAESEYYFLWKLTGEEIKGL